MKKKPRRPAAETVDCTFDETTFVLTEMVNGQAITIDPSLLSGDEITVALGALFREAARRALVLVQAMGPIQPDHHRVEIALRLIPLGLLRELLASFHGADELVADLRREEARRSLGSLLPSGGKP